jgi:hypothetical protein
VTAPLFIFNAVMGPVITKMGTQRSKSAIPDVFLFSAKFLWMQIKPVEFLMLAEGRRSSRLHLTLFQTDKFV